MTAQIAEKLRYQGEDVAMCTNPLSDYFAMGGRRAAFGWKAQLDWWRACARSFRADTDERYRTDAAP